ncbi:MAG TPA: MFS transporter [Bdellovibrionales bacterium]|nr:MFS transporter [Bdellovibrionales bacterium]
MKFLKDLRSVLNLTVIVAGLGYFVDLFDITLYGVVRVASLKDLGITNPDEILSAGAFIYNSMMFGMMIGGLLWGILADKKGRLSVMFGSILLYSLANIANAFAWNVESYALFRFLGGVGLAGELGAAITLVAESLPKEKRGLGTAIVATLGMMGILAAAKLGGLVHWKTAYLVGGLMGIALLFARFKISESSMFQKHAAPAGSRGNFFLLFQRSRLVRYLACIAVGLPVYFTTGVLWTFAPELTQGLGVIGEVTAGDAILYGSIGLVIGDILSGFLSQIFQTRKKVVGSFIALGFLFATIYTQVSGLTNTQIYLLCLLTGICVGFWAVLVTMSAEQFGTNIRATVATTVPNFVRGSAILAVWTFAWLKPTIGAATAAISVATVCFGLALIALAFLSETFGKDLSFEET